MSLAQLVWRSLRFYWREQLGLWVSAGLSTAILTGAMAVGDSIRASLQHAVQLRLRSVRYAVLAGERFFRERLADEIAADWAGNVAPLILLRGVVSVPQRGVWLGKVQVVGADERFWALGGLPAATGLVVNAQLAAALQLHAGDEIIVRLETPSYPSRDAPLAGQPADTVTVRGSVTAVADDARWGSFNVYAEAIAPATVFIPLPTLQGRLDRPDRVNALLCAGMADPTPSLRRHWTIADAGWQLRRLAEGGVELRSERIFFEPPLPHGDGVLTYLVNEIRYGDRATPYSFVAAVSSLGDEEFVINDWLAQDLEAVPGAELALRFYVLEEGRQLREATVRRRVTRIVSTVRDDSWMPDYPGLSDVEDCRAWKPAVPLLLERIRPKDEAYWQRYRGTPKAFVPLATGQQWWRNRFGSLTALRFGATGDDAELMADLQRQLAARLTPPPVQPVAEQARRAAAGTMDFGRLFVGFSLFLIVSALLLGGLLFALHLQQRAAQFALLRALGFPPKRIWGWMVAEAGLVASAGAVAGILAGTAYTRLTLYGLTTIWRDVFGTLHLQYHAAPATWLAGTFAGAAAALVAAGAIAHAQLRQPPARLLSGLPPDCVWRSGRAAGWLAAAALAAATAVIAMAPPGRGPEAALPFFAAGALVLISGVAFCRRFLSGRNLTSVGVLAAAVFLVVAVNAFYQHVPGDPGVRASGTGGFGWLVETTLPVYELPPTEAVVALRVRDGDEASCRNLQRAQQPRLLGVRAEELARRDAFRFVGGSGWAVLRESFTDAIPAVGDEATVRWALGRRLGDVLSVQDDAGRAVRLRIAGLLANSVLQGGLIISEENFLRLFPDHAGYRLFLVEPTAPVASLAERWADRGVTVTPTVERLATLLAVQNTYLAMFALLGGLGLLLGSGGLAVVLWRNVMERRGELALRLAVGFRRRAVHALVFGEHVRLLLLGLGLGVCAAAVAVIPAWRERWDALPLGLLLIVLGGLLTAGLLWCWVATQQALRGRLLDALRTE